MSDHKQISHRLKTLRSNNEIRRDSKRDIGSNVNVGGQERASRSEHQVHRHRQRSPPQTTDHWPLALPAQIALFRK